MSSRIHSVVRVALATSLVVAAAPHAIAQSVFSHQIPLKLPKGANGMQPELALVYTPGSGNGVAGIAWQLTGFPSITRVNYGNGMKCAGGDTYAHSQLGVLVRQPDGTYRTEKESFARFVRNGTCGDGPCSWTVTHASGVKHNFGTTSDSHLACTGLSRRTWGLASAVDLFGNSYEVSYLASSDGQLYPGTLTYTKGPGVTSYRTVEFQYESRTDTESFFHLQDVSERIT